MGPVVSRYVLVHTGAGLGYLGTHSSQCCHYTEVADLHTAKLLLLLHLPVSRFLMREMLGFTRKLRGFNVIRFLFQILFIILQNYNVCTEWSNVGSSNGFKVNNFGRFAGFPKLHFSSSHFEFIFELNNLGGQVSLEELGHTEGTDLVLSEDGDHLGVGCEVLLVLGVLELLALDVSPEALDNLGSGELLSLLGSNEVSELSTEVERLGESGSLGHLDSL